jgi:CheY-like chemotaxis protein
MELAVSLDVLIVEDDTDIRLALEDLLRDEGYETEVASDGAEALDMLGAATGIRPKLILLDLMMPKINGWQLAEAIRDDPRLRDIPILVMSAGESTCRSHPTLRAFPFLSKPIDPEKLRKHVARCCGTPVQRTDVRVQVRRAPAG